MPILRVGSLAPSLEYYVKVLGFKVDWQDPGIAASVSRGRCHIMLCEGDQGHAGGWVWIGVGAIEPLLEEYRTTGAKVRHAPTNYPWAYEMQIEDIDGNVLRMGAEPKDGVPMGRARGGLGEVGGGGVDTEEIGVIAGSGPGLLVYWSNKTFVPLRPRAWSKVTRRRSAVSANA